VEEALFEYGEENKLLERKISELNFFKENFQFTV
jgi:hypothetical protein